MAPLEDESTLRSSFVRDEEYSRTKNENALLRAQICRLKLEVEEVEEERNYNATKAIELHKLLKLQKTDDLHHKLVEKSLEAAELSMELGKMRARNKALAEEIEQLQFAQNEDKGKIQELSEVKNRLKTEEADSDEESEDEEEVELTPENALELTLENMKSQIESLEEDRQRLAIKCKEQEKKANDREKECELKDVKVEMLEELFRSLNNQQQREEAPETPQFERRRSASSKGMSSNCFSNDVPPDEGWYGNAKETEVETPRGKPKRRSSMDISSAIASISDMFGSAKEAIGNDVVKTTRERPQRRASMGATSYHMEMSNFLPPPADRYENTEETEMRTPRQPRERQRTTRRASMGATSYHMEMSNFHPPPTDRYENTEETEVRTPRQPGERQRMMRRASMGATSYHMEKDMCLSEQPKRNSLDPSNMPSLQRVPLAPDLYADDRKGSSVGAQTTIMFDDKEGTYTGPMRDGLPHGVGTIRFVNGDTYVGEVADGEMHGRGTLYHSASDMGTQRGRFENNFFIER